MVSSFSRTYLLFVYVTFFYYSNSVLGETICPAVPCPQHETACTLMAQHAIIQNSGRIQGRLLVGDDSPNPSPKLQVFAFHGNRDLNNGIRISATNTNNEIGYIENRISVDNNQEWSTSIIVKAPNRINEVESITIPITGQMSGNVGIGTTHPTAKLHVNGTILSNGNIIAMGNTGIGTQTPNYKLHVNGNTRLEGSLIVTHNVGIGTTSPQQKLHVVGNINTEGTILAQNLIVTEDLEVRGSIKGSIINWIPFRAATQNQITGKREIEYILVTGQTSSGNPTIINLSGFTNTNFPNIYIESGYIRVNQEHYPLNYRWDANEMSTFLSQTTQGQWRVHIHCSTLFRSRPFSVIIGIMNGDVELPIDPPNTINCIYDMGVLQSCTCTLTGHSWDSTVKRCRENKPPNADICTYGSDDRIQSCTCLNGLTWSSTSRSCVCSCATGLQCGVYEGNQLCINTQLASSEWDSIEDVRYNEIDILNYDFSQVGVPMAKIICVYNEIRTPPQQISQQNRTPYMHGEFRWSRFMTLQLYGGFRIICSSQGWIYV